MKKFLLIIIPFAVLFSACKTTETAVPEDLTPGEIFKEAQTAATEYMDYEKALHYYSTFIERYPDQPMMVIEAEYEVALLYHKLGDDDTALGLFKGILDKYSRPEAAMLPAWPEILSEKLIGIIEGEAEASSTEEE